MTSPRPTGGRFPPGKAGDALRSFILGGGAAGLARALIAAAVLLLAAWYNGFPLLFSDSGEYFARSVQLQVPEYRTFGYPLFLAASWPGPSLWAGIVAQSLLLGALLHQLLRVLAPRLGWRHFAVGAAVLVLFSAAPWVAGQLMPDVFAPITVLATYLAVLHWKRLSGTGRAVALFSLFIGVTTHATHPALAMVLIAGNAVVAWRARITAMWQGIGRATIAMLAGIVMLVSINFAQTGELFFSRGGHVYLLAHLIDAGFAQRVLRADCPRAGYALCPYRDSLPEDAAAFLWAANSPLQRIGGFGVPASETIRLLAATARRYPAALAASTLRYTGRQLVALWTFDGLVSYRALWYVRDFIAYYRPDAFRDFATARQQRGLFAHHRLIPTLHELALGIAAVSSLWLLLLAWRRRAFGVGCPHGFMVTVWLVLVVNAALCGNLSGVFDRYQTRLAWLLPLAVMLSARDIQRQSGRSRQVIPAS